MKRRSSVQNRPPINRVLDHHGWGRSVVAFVDVLKATLALRHPDWSIEELLCHPRQAKRYCDDIRAQTNLSISDDSILSTAFARRKESAGMQKASPDRKRQWQNHAALLEEFGYHDDLVAFAAIMRGCLLTACRGWSFETLTFYPDEAERFCDLVRQKAGIAAPDDFILHVGQRARRRGELKLAP